MFVFTYFQKVGAKVQKSYEKYKKKSEILSKK